MTVGRVTAYQSKSGAGLVIKVSGDFALDIASDFRRTYEDQRRQYKSYAVNLADCTSISSAGLGMLLILRDFAQVPKNDLVIVNCSQEVRETLKISGFTDIFNIQ